MTRRRGGRAGGRRRRGTPQTHAQRFYEFAHQGDYKFLDFEKLKETHFTRGMRQTLHEDCLPGCKSINGYLSAMGHHPKCPHAKEPIQRPVGDLPDVWDDKPGDAVDFRACAALAGLVEILPGGLCAHKKFGPWVSIRAIIVVDADPPNDVLPPVRGLVDDDVAGLAEDAAEADPDDWDAWLRIYKEIERGREHKFGEAQLLYRFAGPFRDQAQAGAPAAPLEPPRRGAARRRRVRSLRRELPSTDPVRLRRAGRFFRAHLLGITTPRPPSSAIKEDTRSFRFQRDRVLGRDRRF